MEKRDTPSRFYCCKRAIKRRERYASMVYRSPKLILFIGQRKKAFFIVLKKALYSSSGTGSNEYIKRIVS